jgi:two-component system, OmpR family, sensor histidine kinase KdpD
VGAALARLETTRKGRVVEVSIPPDLPLVPVDAVLIEQVLVNLLDNAFKYSDPSGPVHVSAEAADGTLAVEVADQGPGLPPGEEERAFEKFHRATTRHRGFGLGLPICRAIVTAHGGRIWAEPLAPRGVAFRFTLPLGEGPSPVDEETRDVE